MTGRVYMGADYRPDHSFRIPDPALSAAIGAPDACLRCHVENDSQWSQNSVLEWYGPGERSHYGTTIAKARLGDTDAGPYLIRLAQDKLYPVNVRATALSMLAAYPGAETVSAMELALMDEEALIRKTAVTGIFVPDMGRLSKLIAPLLDDAVKSVRIEAASRLAGDMSELLNKERQKVFQLVLQEYIDSIEYSADFAASRHNLANLYSELERPDDAVNQYEQAIRIDIRFFPAKMNLAVMYSQRGQNEKAERLLRGVVRDEPELFDAAYSLGLLLVEMKNYQEAVTYLEKASAGLPEWARIHYNRGYFTLIRKI